MSAPGERPTPTMQNSTLPWPEHLQQVFAAIGAAIGSGRLYPETLLSLPSGTDAVLQDHVVAVTHQSGKELGRRKGQYRIEIEGPRFGGGWVFSSGELEKLAVAAAKRS